MPAGFEGSIKAREAELLPVYRQVRLLTFGGQLMTL